MANEELSVFKEYDESLKVFPTRSRTLLDVILPLTQVCLPKSDQVEMTEYHSTENKTRTHSRNVSEDTQLDRGGAWNWNGLPTKILALITEKVCP